MNEGEIQIDFAAIRAEKEKKARGLNDEALRDKARGVGEAAAAKAYQLLRDGAGVRVVIEATEPDTVEITTNNSGDSGTKH